MQAEQMLQAFACRNIVIAGTGYVAEAFWRALERHGYAERVVFCLDSGANGEKRFHQKAVYKPGKAPRVEDAIFCIAVHESLAAEVRNALPPTARESAVWIYPWLAEWLYGPALQDRVRLPLSGILRAQDPGNHWLTIRYMAERDYLRGDERQYAQSAALYRLALMAHCSPATAEKRLRQMEKLTDSIAAGGLMPDRPILLDEDCRVIDGLHRLAAACVLDLDPIPCSVFPRSVEYDRLLKKENRLPEAVLRQLGFTEAQLELLRQAKREILEKAFPGAGGAGLP